MKNENRIKFFGRRGLARLLAIALVLGLTAGAGTGVLAADPPEAASVGAFAVIEVNTVAELKAAAESADEGDVFTLGAGFEADFTANAPVLLALTSANGFTVDGGGATLTYPDQHFSIRSTGGATVTFKDIGFENGTGLYLERGAYIFENCTFTETVSTAIAVGPNGADVTVRNCEFTNNVSAISMNGYGSSSGNSLQISSSRFSHGASSNPVVHAYAATLFVSNTEFSENTGTSIIGSGETAITNCDFINNVTSGYSSGNAIIVHPGLDTSNRYNFAISDCSFIGNGVSGSLGGAAILISATSARETVDRSVTVDRCYFSGNYAAGDRGGAIHAYNAAVNLTVTDSVFEGNTAGKVADPSHSDYNGQTDTDGGAIAVRRFAGGSSDPTTVSIRGCNFKDNHAMDDGGALLMEGLPGVPGTLIADIANCTFEGNSCDGKGVTSGVFTPEGAGGAVQLYGITDSRITHCTFYANNTGNTSGNGSGGAVAVEGMTAVGNPPVLSNNIFIANTGYPSAQANVYIADNPYNDAGTALNNGNIGYDNGKSYDSAGRPVSAGGDTYINGQLPGAGITTANVFAEMSGTSPVKAYFGAATGSATNEAQRYCYLPSPLTDELYRGAAPYGATVSLDVRGYLRDPSPNAGAAEIYWTKFDPGAGEWDTDEIPAGAIASLDAASRTWYLIANPPVLGVYDTVTAFPSRSVTLPGYSFQGWKSDRPDTPGGSDYPTVQAGAVVSSAKQHYTADWLHA
ncbi:MAG: hypothetical protein LBT26_08480, partial [Clostridiales Family XIII bacterium]|nr:hypothetical protein [Clostridiales Family XIII bacterium]